ncbi:ATP-dependent zinc metalloprotease FtsH [Echinicola jeungdonensis]|uniref:ATP-dependent zinc metalloprotease FtsH n=1 Tax=Echinicola jeungdonensis TaxID=709343 RepID=A0ABV5J959_9BACT|nr:ATP-dependent zinc metalloprotease FtsH [Echinicola jeungdonensis]MDN3670537.1 ATP-dependent zinc metalloprotease FtsH [Echinicola jeungdonensis]
MTGKKPPLTKKRNQKPDLGRGWIYVILLFILFSFWYSGGQTGIQEITWKQFEENYLKDQEVDQLVVVNKQRVEVYIKKEHLDDPQYQNLPENIFTGTPSEGPHFFFTIGSVEVFHDQLEKAQADLPHSDHVPVKYRQETNWWTNLIWLLPFFFLIFLWIFIIRGSASRMKNMGSSVFNFSQSKAREMEKGGKNKVVFDDIAGLEEAKEEIYEMVKFLKSPEKFRNLGAKIPKGVLLVGPPGTGKTMLAKAVAGEADVPFFSLSGSEFVEMFVGVGAARMRDLFKKAKEKAPSIIFIDEIDTVGRARGKAHAFQSNDEREGTLNQLLAELDGFDTDTGVIVLAATNRGDVLDPALLRPGRFDRHIHLELPNLKERVAIFKVHMRDLKLAPDIEPELLASQSPGFSGADIANICNEAALIAARREKKAVDKHDFMDAIDRIIGGLEKKSKIITPEEKERISIHEAGHVTVSWFLEHSYPVLKVSIIPRGKSLGAAWYLPEEHQIITKKQLFDAICVGLGGRAAEKIIFDEVSTNALDDLEKVTKQAYAMVMNYGLSDELRNLSYYDSTGRYEQSLQKPFSENTAEKIDKEVQQIIDDAFDRTERILQDHQDQLQQLAKSLKDKEILHKEDIEKILGKKKVNKPYSSLFP